MAYLEDFYPLDIDDSYLEYVISELTPFCDDNGILLLGVVKLVIERFHLRAQRVRYYFCNFKMMRMTVTSLLSKCVVMKALQN